MASVLPLGQILCGREISAGNIGARGLPLRVRVSFIGSSRRKSSKYDHYFASSNVDLESAEEKIQRLTATVERLKARIAELEGLVPSTRSRVEESMEQQPTPKQLLKSITMNVPVLKPEPSQKLGEIDRLPSIVWPSPSDEIPLWNRGRLRHEVAGLGSTKDVENDRNPLYIIHVTAEMVPLAKVGGLADVVTGLSRACIDRGHKVEIMIPFYECIPGEQIKGFSPGESYSSYHNGNWISVQVYRGKIAGVSVLLVQPKNQFFKGSSIYGGSYDELEAYLFFSRACLEWMQVTNNHPDIIHAHEWHTGAVSMLYWDMYHHLSLKKPRLVLTIHNMEHYGECRMEQLNMCGLEGSTYRTSDKVEAVDDRTIGHNPERLSLLKGGIVYSNAVTTVSPSYVNETLCSGWLSSTLMKHRSKYFGILNGIDTELWNPETDPYLPVGFSATDLMGKQACKQYLQRGLGLEPDELPTQRKTYQECKRSPLIVCITRLVAQKGIHLIRHAMYHVDQMDGQFVLLGTSRDPRVKGEFEHHATKFGDSKKVRLLLTYSEELAHLLYAAADIVLVPSMFEPCGLTQMIGMRYGAIPVVRKTGGLADTVFDVEHSKAIDANGFVFEGIDERSLNSALDRALQQFCEKPHHWQALVSKVMLLDNSWNKSAREYVSVYNSVRV
ncbi:uncharacterized protein LOC112350504 isoform X1 [Selaginella moellendorffii]|uniref:uncharacterized protein LOC112350504 isoform X1 n=1 Tax=Selaginella moellendorffii TaxID=88036 RepID=UPI000D1CC153|nr:uncharacterized protein LOC112350504 isoform X1 [Selaginella moellendorffii]|eukprot:XP_024542597.1 uncharacterized protein LOC112350504 isoform X1 [Selaginella moellendorffii]